MIHTIKVTNPQMAVIWEKSLEGNEGEIVKKYVYEEKGVFALKGLLYPIRTHNLRDFAKDFFFPSPIAALIKVHRMTSLFFKVILITISLIVDVTTFPIRVITCIPRALNNKKKEEDTFYRYLMDQKVDLKLLVFDFVKVELKGMEDRYLHYSLKKKVHFIEVPYYEEKRPAYISSLKLKTKGENNDQYH